MKRAAILSIAFLLPACGQKTAAPHQNDSPAPGGGNTMHCVAGGVKLAGTGSPQVEIAGFGIQNNTISGFGIILNVQHDGKMHQVSTSLMALPMQAGAYHFPDLATPGATLAFHNIRTMEGNLHRGYNGGIYGQQFSPVENDPEAKLKMVVDKMAVADAPQPGFKRVRIAGRFAFNAAALPGFSPSDACSSDGIARSLASVKAGKRLLPLYDAATCGAEKQHVQCDFDVAADFVN